MELEKTRQETTQLVDDTAVPPLCQTEERICPECGSPMSEVDRRQENGTMYLWLECVDTVCGYQWLDHFACW